MSEKEKFRCQPCKKHDPYREDCTCELDCSWMHKLPDDIKPEVRHKPGKGL